MIRITQDLIRTVIYEGDEPVVPTDLARARLVFRVAPSGEVEMLKNNTHAIARVARLTPERATGGHANIRS
jgi:hypothetical protein